MKVQFTLISCCKRIAAPQRSDSDFKTCQKSSIKATAQPDELRTGTVSRNIGRYVLLGKLREISYTVVLTKNEYALKLVGRYGALRCCIK